MNTATWLLPRFAVLLPFTILFLGEPTADWLEARLDDDAVRSARLQIADHCRGMKDRPCPPVVVRIMKPDEAPYEIVAHTTREGQTCTLHFTRERIRNEISIAHELCHCVNDLDELTSFGWKWTTGIEERERREKEAQRCAKRLTTR